MSEPLISSDDLATYLNDPSIDEDRADTMIADATQACETIVNPVPAAAAYIVKRVAGRGYSSAVRGGGKQAVAGGSPFGAVPGAGAIYLTRYDERDLRRVAGGGGAFSIDLLPADYTPPCGTFPLGDWDEITELNQ